MDRIDTGGPDTAAWPAPERLLEAFGVEAGTTVAVVGSSAVALPVATAVAPGTVYAVDRDGTVADELEVLALDRGIENLVTIAAGADVFAAELPELVDVVLIVGALPSLDAPTAFGEQASRALRPGGRLLIVNGRSDGDGRQLSPADTRSVLAPTELEQLDAADLGEDIDGLVFARAHDQ